MTSCEAERSVSTLKRVKTCVRNLIADNRLNGLIILNIHCEIEVDIDDVLKEFTQNKNTITFGNLKFVILQYD